MQKPIRQFIESLELPAFMKELEQVQCRVTFWGGRKFHLNGCEGTVRVNEIVSSVYQKALIHAGKVDGMGIYDRLVKVNQVGENELAKKPFWFRWVNMLARLFTA